jgi:hypothetical protein
MLLLHLVTLNSTTTDILAFSTGPKSSYFLGLLESLIDCSFYCFSILEINQVLVAEVGKRSNP